MKKTLVAVAAMAAVTGAMAEVTISGQLDQAYNTVRTTTAGQVSSTRTTLSNNALGQDALNFGVTEDVGGGITAYGNVNTIFNATTAAGSALTVDNGSGIGVRGEFGDIRLGVSYADTFFTSAASDASMGSWYSSRSSSWSWHRRCCFKYRAIHIATIYQRIKNQLAKTRG